MLVLLQLDCGTSVAEAVLQLWKQILKIHWFVVGFFFPLDKDRIKPVFLHGYRNIPLCTAWFLLEEFRHLLMSLIIPF